jgi:hypothetical protein
MKKANSAITNDDIQRIKLAGLGFRWEILAHKMANNIEIKRNVIVSMS